MQLVATDLELIRNHALQARAVGKSFSDNPFLRRERLPWKTNESIEEWQVKHDTWRDGWVEEDDRRNKSGMVPVPAIAA